MLSHLNHCMDSDMIFGQFESEITISMVVSGGFPHIIKKIENNFIS